MAEKAKIVFEDKWLMVVDKPASWVTTREKKSDSKNIYLEDWVGELEEGQKKLPRNGVVHRLDKGTSGLVIVAKTKDVLEKMKKLVKERQVVKVYLALAGGDLPGTGEMNVPVGRSKYSFGKFTVDPEGKRAVTTFEVVKKIQTNGRVYSLVRVGLKTGRTHQIRVHFKYLGWPLAGDKVYGGGEIPGLDRQFLHAHSLNFLHPITGVEVNLVAELPDDLKKIAYE